MLVLFYVREIVHQLDLTSVSSHSDSAGREHIVLVDLPPGFPEVAPTASAVST